jgi:hypothetical protein
MGIEIIAPHVTTKTEDDSLRVETLYDGERRLFRGLHSIADDGQGALADNARFAMAIRNFKPRGCAVAMIGGGFGILPRLLWKDFTITVYEIEPRLDRFIPNWCTFVPGDYRDTLTGTYDVIVYDLGGDVPRTELSAFLNSGGIILP